VTVTWTGRRRSRSIRVPEPAVAGVSHNITVTAKDAHNNTATDYSGTVHFTSSDGAAVLPADTTLAAGVGTFTVTLKTAGTQSVTATDTVTSISGSQSGIVVTPAAATTLVVSGLASPQSPVSQARSPSPLSTLRQHRHRLQRDRPLQQQ